MNVHVRQAHFHWHVTGGICLRTFCLDPSPPSSLSPSQEGFCVHEKQGHVSETLAPTREILSKEEMETYRQHDGPQ